MTMPERRNSGRKQENVKAKLYRKIARTLQAIENCREVNNVEWIEKHQAMLTAYEAALPSGSGIDSGSHILGDSKPDRIRISADYHHMDANGFYGRWTEHVIVVKPTLLSDFDLTITGQNFDDIKAYLNDVYSDALAQEIS